jgi:uncharacterized cupredoxin-like copper-binding protein
MKKIALISLFAIGLLVAACSSTTSAATQAPAQPPVTQAPTAVAQSNPTAAGTGTEVDVTLADNTIQSSLANFQVGVPYTFVIKNTGRHAHNFNISQPVSATGSIDASLSSALLTVKQDQLAPGSGTSVTFTFPDSAVGQQLEFSCLIRQHYEDGMKLAITVTK